MSETKIISNSAVPGYTFWSPEKINDYLTRHGKRFPVYGFTKDKVITDQPAFTIAAAELREKVCVKIDQGDIDSNRGGKGDYICYNPTKGGFYFIHPKDFFEKTFLPKKGNGIMEILKDTIPNFKK